MTATQHCRKLTLRGRSGHVLSRASGDGNGLVALGGASLVQPWRDPGLHLHTGCEEYYLVLQGELQLLVVDRWLTLQPRELLLVRPGVAHAVVGGQGIIEHIGVRAPDLDDKRPLGDIPDPLPAPLDESEREVRAGWGCRVPLTEDRNRNCWLFGRGMARFRSQYLTFAYLDFPTPEMANAGLGTRHRPHLHQRSWEYYAVLRGSKLLRVENQLVTVQAGEVLEVPPGLCHVLHERQAPLEGFTFRVPVDLDDKVEC